MGGQPERRTRPRFGRVYSWTRTVAKQYSLAVARGNSEHRGYLPIGLDSEIVDAVIVRPAVCLYVRHAGQRLAIAPVDNAAHSAHRSNLRGLFTQTDEPSIKIPGLAHHFIVICALCNQSNVM